MSGQAATRKHAPVHGLSVSPDQVIPTLKKYMVVDGFDIVVDLRRSQGSYIVDARDGKRYLDFFTFVASSPIGLNHPKITTPEFKEKLAYVSVNKPSNSDIYTVEHAEFIETFARLAIPEYLPHVFLIEGGALAVENALKTAFDWKIRKNQAKGHREERGTKVIHFYQSFHGRSGYTMSMTNTDPNKVALFPKFGWPRVLNPAVRFPLNGENLSRVEKDEATSIAQMKDAFRAHKDEIAAVIIEPIQGEGGDNHFRQEFFTALRQLSDENEAMLIFDEVQTGLGLTGKMWAHQHFVEPDILAFGKKMQVCGILCGVRVEEVKDNVFSLPSRLNSTWGGNLTDMVRAQKYLEIIDEENLVDNARVAGEHLVAKLGDLMREFPDAVSNPRGRGLFAAFDLRNTEERNAVRKKCLQNGLIILPSGDKAIRFRPPLNVSLKEIDEGLDIIRQSTKEVV